MSDAKTDNYGWESAEAMCSAAYLHDPIRRLVREAGARDVIDAGCGNGALCADLAKDGCNILGVDGDEQGIAIARAQYPAIPFRVQMFGDSADFTDVTQDGKFDYLVSTEVVEHLYAPHELAAFCFRVLRPGGQLAMSTPYHGYLKNLALSATNAWDKHHTVDWHGGHIKFWSRKTLTKLLTDAGFVVTGFVGAGRLPYLWKSMILTARKPEGSAP